MQPIPSQSYQLSLDQVLSGLRQHVNVEAVLTLGSTAVGSQTAASDYDLLIILHEMPYPMEVLLTTINGRLSDVLFAPATLLTRVLNRELQTTFSQYESIVIGHLGTGRVEYDENGRLSQIRTILNDTLWQSIPTDEDIYWHVIHGVNFNYQHNKRYHSNPDPVYQMTLDIRLNYSVAQVLFGYFEIRKITWQGEKKAIQYWQESDPIFFAAFEHYHTAHTRHEKFAFYTQLAQQTLAPIGGLWPDDSVNMVLDGDWTVADIPNAIDYWHSLLVVSNRH